MDDKDLAMRFNCSFNKGATFKANFSNVQKVSGGTNDYDQLINHPSVNGEELIGNKTSIELGIINDKFFEFEQLSPSNEWRIEHPLNKFPSVTIIDSGGSIVIGDVSYVDESNIVVSFQSAFSGKAYLN